MKTKSKFAIGAVLAALVVGAFEVLFGCRHKSFSFPITRKAGQPRSAAAAKTGTYVACLECGKEFAYDWQEMKIIKR